MVVMAQEKKDPYSNWLFKVGANLVDSTGDEDPFDGFEVDKMGFLRHMQ